MSEKGRRWAVKLYLTRTNDRRQMEPTVNDVGSVDDVCAVADSYDRYMIYRIWNIDLESCNLKARRANVKR